ncbi:MAG: Do family serine endopeptidase, partial [Alphaproteobacteria bacterium]|nr:Do family serine endopeptidase [Alphaproteobacteria bacterium]
REQVRMSFAPVVKATAPAVVNVYTRKVVRSAASPLLNDPFFRHFFGDRLGSGPQERIQRSLGSGVVVGAEGMIVTNHHVIKDSDAITVVLADRREFDASVVGADERTDLAVLRIDPRGERLPVLPLGDSDQLEVGDLVLAIGNPFGVGQTVTSGIVSAVARTSTGISDLGSFIQTDAAINPGNSGGALIDVEGRLIGINTAIFSKDGGSNGIGFAIPATMVRAVLAGILQGGKAVRPWLGAGGQAVTADMAGALGLARPMGVLINGLHKAGPAEQAGVQVGDVVVAVNGREVDDGESLRFRIATLPVGGTAELSVMRKGRPLRLAVRLVPPAETPPREETAIGGKTPFTGATIANLNPALAEELGIGGALDGGVVILTLERRSVAQRLGLKPGDIVLRINDRPVATVGDLTRLVRTGASWKITIRRDDEVLSLMVEG